MAILMTQKPTYEKLAQRVLELEKTEKALKESEQRYRRLTENSPDMIYRMSLPDGNYEYVSPAATYIFGYPPDAWYDNPFLIRKIIHPDWHWYFEEQWENLLNGHVTPTYEYKIIHKDQSVRWINQRNILVKDDNGRPVAIEGVATDITERKQVETRIKESEERYRTVADFTYDWEHWVAPDGNFLYVSPSCERITGHKAQDFIDNPSLFLEIIHPDDHRSVNAHFYDQHHMPNPEHIEFRILTKAGQKRWISHSCQPVYGSEGQWLGRRASNRDVTEIKQIEEQLRHAQRMEAIGTLAGGIAHDFNNILTPILMGTELAQLTIPEDDLAQEHLWKVLQAGHRAKELVKQILTFSRQDEEKVKPLKLIPIVKEVVKLIRASLPATIEINQHIQAQSDIILANPIQIHQVIMNLCTNAAYAMREKGGILEIGLTNDTMEAGDLIRSGEIKPGNFVKITVQDTGHGIDSRIRENIFDPFFTTKEREEGTGMGLSMVHGIVKSLEGAIAVASEPLKGTLFSVYLPCVKAELVDENEKRESAPPGTERLLFIDDEPMIPEIYESMLQQLGYHVEIRTKPLEAWDYFCENPDKVDMMITDQTMPYITGIELAKKVLELRPGLPIILCTGFSQQEVVDVARNAGISAVLFKPIGRLTFAQTIRNILDSVASYK
jgi:PAS domain S-box-containing protein